MAENTVKPSLFLRFIWNMRFAKFLQRRLFAEIRTAFWIEVNFLVFRPPPPLLVEEKLNIRIYVYGIYIYIYIYIYGS